MTTDVRQGSGDSVRRDRQLGYKWKPEMSNAVRRLGKDDVELLRSGVCPFCHAGPFTVAASHVNKAHGIDREQLRVMLGVNQGTTICDPTHSASTAERVKRRNGDDWAERAQRNVDRKAAGRKTSERRLAKAAERDAMIVADFEDGLSYQEIAQRRGVHEKTIRTIVSRAGFDVDGRTRRGERERGAPQPHLEEGRKAHKAKLDEERSEILAAIDAGEPIRALATRLGVSVRTIRNRMYKHGIKLPKDADRAYRSGPREKQPPWYCGAPGCARLGNCQGLCRMHYQRAKAEAKKSGRTNAEEAQRILAPSRKP